ncbi:MAG: peptidoglycan-binding protein [Candidatus Nealsonbacteria bacterium]
MKKKIIISIFACTMILAGALAKPVLSQAENVSAQDLAQRLKAQIEELRSQIIQLQEQLVSLKEVKQEVKETTQEIKESLQLAKRLRRGMTGEDVKLLQEILSTDSEIYPEGLVTGYFGPLTERAVIRFQKKMGVEQVGLVGPKTLSKINELLKEGAGSSGKVPPGLLIAPGIKKKIGYAPNAPEGQELPYGISKKLDGTSTSTDEDDNGDVQDTQAPVISSVSAAGTTATSTRITWVTDEVSDSNLFYGLVTPLEINASTSKVSSLDLVLNHDLTIDGLTSTITYYYLVTSMDSSGNTATGSEDSFTTIGE